MGYAHIENLYRPEAQRILLFRECYALEKIHGTSAHVAWDGSDIRYHSGGEKHENFVKIFDGMDLAAGFAALGKPFTIYGEAYGGKCQGMKATYGDKLKFVAFDVQIGDAWLSVPDAATFVERLGLEFVYFQRIPTDLATLDAARDWPSAQARRNGILEPRMSEGVVLRPPFECTGNDGSRICAKHKRPEFSERKTIPDVDPSKREMLEKAEAIAEEWVTEMRLTHVLDKLGNPTEMADTGKVIEAMVEDVCREASGEIRDSKAARKAIGGAAAKLFKDRLRKIA